MGCSSNAPKYAQNIPSVSKNRRSIARVSRSWDIVHYYRRNPKGVWQRNVVDTIPALIHTTCPDGLLDISTQVDLSLD